ncbi:HNH endonuclease [Rhodococcus qingshengii]|uniref:HNH endonuclease n=1 Tax=Rhodococcus qingshengii TaxID=334542 RepID=UPI002942DE55|nr:HNH endonuclease [Rhodococcus qingshengii]WOI86013.1 HNH endonuclease [Rhodococcus qingshengii]
MKKIPLSGRSGKGKFTFVDDDIAKHLPAHIYLTDGGYASLPGGMPIHRLVMPAVAGKTVDHKNRDKLDNRRINLRYATPQEQVRNRGTMHHNKSGYKGVVKKGNRWRATIYTGPNDRIQLGYFRDSAEAALAYDCAAIQLFGEYASLNIIGRRA